MSAPNETHTNRDSEVCNDPRELGKWTRVYAQNRTVPLMVFMVVFLLLCAAIGASSCLVVWAYLRGNMLVFVPGVVLLALAVAADVYISVPRWGGKRMEQISARLYAREGNVAVACGQTAGRRRLGACVGAVFGVCVLASIILGLLGHIPEEYMQPVSAIYVVPFLLVLHFMLRPAAGRLMLLWPTLYAVHAILIVAGAPILFTGHWQGLNMLIPIAGYGLLAGLVAHLYSRFALHRVKRLARMDLPGGGQ